jgi:tetratricopeptide (TPR) repeat protein
MNQTITAPWRRFVSTFPLIDTSGFSCRAIPQLPPGEYERFVKAWRLLATGELLALTKDGDMPLSGAGVCEALLARSWEARYHSPERMLRLASAAQEVSAGLRTRDMGTTGLAAMQARAWGELANAFRVAGNAKGAATAFEEAFDREHEIHDPYLSAHLLHLRAALYGSQGDAAFAAQLLELVGGFYDNADEPHLGGRTRITHSIYASRAGRHEAALQLSDEGLARIDRALDPSLLMTALHNRLLLLLSLGRKDEARRTLALCGGFDTAGPLAMRLRWMEGRIFHALGELEDAERALRQSRDGLSSLGLQLFTAIASLDLTATLLLQNRLHDAQIEALTAQRLFLGLQNREDYFAVLVVLEAAFSSGGVTAAMVERSLAFLRCRETGR